MVGLESADGAPHRVRLRVLTPRGLNPLGAARRVDVPAQGRIDAGVALLRGTARARHATEWWSLAAATDGPLERPPRPWARSRCVPDGSVLPKIRLPLAVLAVALLAAGVAGASQVWRRWPTAHMTAELEDQRRS